MSFIGNIAAAQSAKAIGKYNESVAYQQAAYERKKAAVQQKVYDNIEKPRFVDQQKQQFSNFFVSALRTGAEFRDGYEALYFTGTRLNKSVMSGLLALFSI